MRAAIIEDERIHADILKLYLESWGRQRETVINTAVYPSAESFLFAWNEGTGEAFDVLFVDIQMENAADTGKAATDGPVRMNGMDMAKRVRQRDGNIAIVFTTGVADYIEEGYEVEAIHYLLKPVSEEKIAGCMDRIMSRKKSGHFILVHRQDDVVKLNVEDICYIEARGHGCVLGIRKNKEQQVRESISELERLLQEGFVRCHRSYLCNMENIHHITKTDIFFDDGSFIPVSRRMYSDVNRAFIAHFSRRTD